MNIAQHLASVLLVVLSVSAQAQEAPQESAPEQVSDKAPEVGTSQTQENSLKSSSPVTEPSAVSEKNEDAKRDSENIDKVIQTKKTIFKSAATRDYSKAMFFDQVDNGLTLPPMELDYALSEDGKQLRIGSVTVGANNFFFGLLPLGKAHAGLKQILPAEDLNKLALVMAWPEQLIPSGTVEMISKTGAVLWSSTISESTLGQWKQKIEGWRKSLKAAGVPAKEIQQKGIFGTQFAILDVQAAGVFARATESFRFCLSFSEGRNSSKLCSQRYALKKSQQGLSMGKVRTDEASPRVLVAHEEAAKKQIVSVALDIPTSFYAELVTGESYEFVTLPNKLQIMDISDTKSPQVLRVIGYDTKPVGRTIALNPSQYSSLTKLIGFEETIGDARKFWAAAVSAKDPRVYLPGKGGGIFLQRLETSEVPRRFSRVYLHRQTPTGTYIDGVVLEARKPVTASVTSSQNSVELDANDPAHFYWNFKAAERGKINRSYLDVNFEGKTYKSYFEIFKGYPRELSARLSAVGTAGSLVFLGELAYNQWLEDLFGWTNYTFSRQRWGFAGKYFQSINQLKVDSSGKTAPLSVLTMDLKYRLTPGLWGRDETLGVLGSYQSVTFDQLKAPMMGVGAFWARSMPRSIDNLFNIVPLMRYPKWVDMEFIYYVSSLDSKVTLNSSMSLNFHGKVLWTENLFGEAGFGVKRYGFSNTSLNQKAELNTFYGTMGLGLSF